MAEYDVIIVGAGPAGCALAARLADARPSDTVALIEAGPATPSWMSTIPAALMFALPFRNRHNYAFETVPQAGLAGRRGYQPRGRGLGGSSLINAMCYVRGAPSDYDDWARAGCEGWSWRDLLPLFRRAERNERGADDFHGDEGPLNVADLRVPNEIASLFLRAGEEAGYETNADFNGARQDGFGFYQVYQRDGRRCSAADAYLGGRTRPNLDVIADLRVESVAIEGGRATGVVARRGREPRRLAARREVVLSAGAFGTPQLLMLSGIGPAAELRALGIPVRRDRPGVGRNLQDHCDVTLQRRVADRRLVGMVPGWAIRMVPEWRRLRNGKPSRLSSNLAEAGAFIRSSPALDRPDLQLHFVVAIADDHGRKAHLARGLSIHVCPLRPASRGSVRLASADPAAAPLIDPAYLSAPGDLEAMVRGFRIARDVMATPALASLGGRDLYPERDDSDASVAALVRARADTIYHPVGTCRMGADADAVVDPRLRVRGVDGLRVVDASIMPSLIGGNTQAIAAVIGEKAADLMAGANA